MAQELISIKDIGRKYVIGAETIHALKSVSLSINKGEFVALMGPSGSGKSTLMNILGCLDTPTKGEYILNGINVSEMTDNDLATVRNQEIGFVFQTFNLLPRSSALDNVALPLVYAGVKKEDRDSRALKALENVGLGNRVDHKPNELSGGQRQRVALARALVNRPKVLLLDEPLGALDLKLRQQMQIELKEIQRQVGITFVFVTHDQEEALTMSDRIAVFNNGRIQQIDTPSVIYEHPKNEFVAGFVGTSNLLSKDVAKQILNSDETFTVRPEKITLELGIVKASATQRSATGKVQEVEYLGPSTRFIVKLDAGSSLVVLKQNSTETSEEVSKLRNQIVTLLWEKQSEYRVGS
ncbi:MAG: polyamine transporter ATP-binding protein [Actinomycetota bacterium]